MVVIQAKGLIRRGGRVFYSDDPKISERMVGLGHQPLEACLADQLQIPSSLALTLLYNRGFTPRNMRTWWERQDRRATRMIYPADIPTSRRRRTAVSRIFQQLPEHPVLQ